MTKLTPERIEEERAVFEESIFNAYFIANCGPMTDWIAPAPDMKTKDELCMRGSAGEYLDQHIDAMWFGWQRRALYAQPIPEYSRSV